MVSPCGTWNIPPIACPSECSAVQSAMFMVRPAMRLPQAMSARASASAPSRNAATSEPPMSRIASSAIASPIGVRTRATIPAIACASASMPVWAVASGGTECVRIGSTTASWARSAGEAMPALRAARGSVMTAPPETSEPVPAVVGTATSGDDGVRERAAALGEEPAERTAPPARRRARPWPCR